MENHLEFKKFTRHLSKLSGEVIRKYFRKNFSIIEKQDSSPVTIADKKAEEVMRNEIMKNFPEHGIIGEEFDDHTGSSPYKWVLDPIDGTKGFICGTVNFGTLIALLKNDKPLLGVFNQPILNEFLIGDNKSALLNGKKVSVRNCARISEAVLLTTDFLNIKKYQNLKKFENLMNKVKFIRGWGDCYGYYLVATGFADIMVDPIMSFWDIAALVPIIRGAGGIITDYQGNDAMKGSSAIAASPKIHEQVIRELNK